MKMTGFRFIMGCSLVNMANLLGPHSYPWHVGVGVAGLGWVSLGLRQGVLSLKEQRKEQEVQARRQRTEELEKDLGYEPLNLHELDEILLNDQQHRKREQ